jgi:serine/threonine-protein kinase
VQAAQTVEPEAMPQRVSARPAAAPVNQRVTVFAGIAALAVIGVAVLAMFDRGRGEPVPSGPLSAASAPAPVASSAASASPALAALSPPPVTASAPAVTPVVQPTRHAAASAARPAASASRRAAASPKVAAVTPPPSPVELPRPAPEHVPAASEIHPETRVAAGAPRSPASSPADICKDKLFLLKEICLAEQCDKPAARTHPLCVQRRADAKLREESKVRN